MKEGLDVDDQCRVWEIAQRNARSYLQGMYALQMPPDAAMNEVLRLEQCLQQCREAMREDGMPESLARDEDGDYIYDEEICAAWAFAQEKARWRFDRLWKAQQPKDHEQHEIQRLGKLLDQCRQAFWNEYRPINIDGDS